MAHAEYQLTLPARTETDDEAGVAAVLGKAKAQIGMIPNMYGRMANVPGLLETYLTGVWGVPTGLGVEPREQAIVLLAISRANRCAYCVAAHSTAADIAKLPTEVTDALRAGDPLPDARLDALATFTTIMVDKRGLPSRADVEAFLPPASTSATSSRSFWPSRSRRSATTAITCSTPRSTRSLPTAPGTTRCDEQGRCPCRAGVQGPRMS